MSSRWRSEFLVECSGHYCCMYNVSKTYELLMFRRNVVSFFESICRIVLRNSGARPGVFTAVRIHCSVVNITQYRTSEDNRRFGGTRCLFMDEVTIRGKTFI
jgi:hypothetical protein